MARVRVAREVDLEGIMECTRGAYGKYVERMGREPAPLLADYGKLIAEGVVYVLIDGEEVCGLVVMRAEGGSLLVENVAVDVQFQGRGLGRMLMEFVEQEARRRGLGEVRLYTNEVMVENLAFYGKLGFEEEGRRVEDGYRRVFLRRRVG